MADNPVSGRDNLNALLHLLERRGDRPAVVALGAETRTWSYRDLASRGGQLAAGLSVRGVTRGTPVALFAPNSPEWMAANLALLLLGAIPVPLDTRQGEEGLAHCLEDSGCRYAFTTRSHAAALRRTHPDAEKLDVIFLDEASGEEGTAEDKIHGTPWREILSQDSYEQPKIDADDTAVLFYTSGTTGVPKGVPLTHRNLMVNLDGLLSEDLVDEADRALMPLPLHHVYPYMVGMLVPLAIGIPIILPAGISGPELAQALREGRTTVLIGVPRLYDALADAIRRQTSARGAMAAKMFQSLLRVSIWMNKRFGWRAGRLLFAPVHRQLAPNLRLLVSGGAQLDPDLAWTLKGLGWEVLSGYGLTETAPIVSFNSRNRNKLESVGQPLRGVEVRIDPIEGKEGGEIVVRGPNVFSHYHNKPEETKKALTDGWFHTGDLGFLDKDGFLHIAARVKETIVLPGGENVFPEEVEKRFMESSYIREAAVMERDGRLVLLAAPEPKAFRDGDAGRDPEPKLREEVARISRALPSYQRISDVVMTREALPRTTIGKLRRHELAEIYERAKEGRHAAPQKEEELSAADRELLRDERAGHVREWLERRFPGKPIKLDSDLNLDIGIDSLDWVTLSLELEEEIGVRLSEDSIAEIETVRNLLEAVRGAPKVDPSAKPEELTPEQKQLIAPKGAFLRFLALLLYGLNKLIFRVLYRLRVQGLDRMPEKGPFILAPNHASMLDPFALAAALPYKRAEHVYWAGFVDLLFGSAPKRLFSRATNTFPVDPLNAPVSSLSFGKAILDRGDALVWFPEGARSPDGQLQPFLPGIGQLAQSTQATVVPVFIGGTYDAWPRQRRFPRLGRVLVTFGEPLPTDRLKAAGSGQSDRDKIAEALRNVVADLAAKKDMAA